MSATIHRVLLLALAVGLLGMIGEASAPARSNQAYAEWLAGVLKQITALKPGMARKDFEKTFVMDGGLRGLSESRYCYRECPYIKVDVTFEAPTGAKTPVSDPDAKLIKISKPYLQTPYTD